MAHVGMDFQVVFGSEISRQCFHHENACQHVVLEMFSLTEDVEMFLLIAFHKK